MQLLYTKLIKIQYKCPLLFPTSANSITIKIFKTPKILLVEIVFFVIKYFFRRSLPRNFGNWKPESVNAFGKQNQIKPTLPTSSYPILHTLSPANQSSLVANCSSFCYFLGQNKVSLNVVT